MHTHINLHLNSKPQAILCYNGETATFNETKKKLLLLATSAMD